MVTTRKQGKKSAKGKNPAPKLPPKPAERVTGVMPLSQMRPSPHDDSVIHNSQAQGPSHEDDEDSHGSQPQRPRHGEEDEETGGHSGGSTTQESQCMGNDQTRENDDVNAPGENDPIINNAPNKKKKKRKNHNTAGMQIIPSQPNSDTPTTDSPNAPNDNHVTTQRDSTNVEFIIKATGEVYPTSYHAMAALEKEYPRHILNITARPTRDGDFKITPLNEQAVEILREITVIGNNPVTIVEKSNNQKDYLRVVRNYPSALPFSRVEEISGVKWAKRLQSKQGRDTPHGLVAFEGEAPEVLDLGWYGVYALQPYAREPIRCFRCQRFNHHQSTCNAAPRCGVCAGRHETQRCIQRHRDGTATTPRCPNCAGPHHAWNNGCPRRKEVLHKNNPQIIKPSKTATTNSTSFISKKYDWNLRRYVEKDSENSIQEVNETTAETPGYEIGGRGEEDICTLTKRELTDIVTRVTRGVLNELEREGKITWRKGHKNTNQYSPQATPRNQYAQREPTKFNSLAASVGYEIAQIRARTPLTPLTTPQKARLQAPSLSPPPPPSPAKPPAPSQDPAAGGGRQQQNAEDTPSQVEQGQVDTRLVVDGFSANPSTIMSHHDISQQQINNTNSNPTSQIQYQIPLPTEPIHPEGGLPAAASDGLRLPTPYPNHLQPIAYDHSPIIYDHSPTIYNEVPMMYSPLPAFAPHSPPMAHSTAGLRPQAQPPWFTPRSNGRPTRWHPHPAPFAHFGLTTPMAHLTPVPPMAPAVCTGGRQEGPLNAQPNENAAQNTGTEMNSKQDV